MNWLVIGLLFCQRVALSKMRNYSQSQPAAAPQQSRCQLLEKTIVVWGRVQKRQDATRWKKNIELALFFLYAVSMLRTSLDLTLNQAAHILLVTLNILMHCPKDAAECAKKPLTRILSFEPEASAWVSERSAMLTYLCRYIHTYVCSCVRKYVCVCV